MTTTAKDDLRIRVDGGEDATSDAAGGADKAASRSSERLLTPEILALAAVVVLGSIMTILDATIVNVALPDRKSTRLNSSH